MARVNRAIELLSQDQPVYYTGVPELTYEAGKCMAGTWADVLQVEFEHAPFDPTGLAAFMDGLRDAGPTRSGHPTPAVWCTLPANGVDANEVLANAWQIRQILAAGAHGLLLCHARDPDAVRAFVRCARYPAPALCAVDQIGEGLRGLGGQTAAARVWGLDPVEYLRRADPWPLNPEGELLLGLKLENRHALVHAGDCAAVPGIGFAEWGPGDMGLSLGHLDAHDPPYPADMDAARNTVKAACDAAGVAFLCGWQDSSLTPVEVADLLINRIGARLMSGGPDPEALAAAGRRLTGRKLPV